MNKFDKLKEIKELRGDIEPRHDPTVAPRGETFSQPAQRSLPEPRVRENETQYYTCKDYYDAYSGGRTTPLDVVERLLPLIKRPKGKHSTAFLDSKEDIIRAAATASTKRYQQGKQLGALDGVPISVKDEADLSGYRRTLGSMLDFTNPSNETAWCVKKWEEAGAIIIGKTNMHECGLSTTGHNPNTGTPLNPHNFGWYCGGSSSGSAYSVATGLSPVSLGVDGGGSIRLPASYCGVYGLKPSHGRVSARPTRDLGTSVGAYGPIAATIDDLALGYRIMAQPDPLQRQSAMFPDPDSEIGTHSNIPKVIGICDAWVSRADPEVGQMFAKAVQHFEKCGYDVCRIHIPLLPEAQKAHALTILSEIRAGLTKEQVSQLLPSNQLLLNVSGSQGTAQDFLSAQKMRDLLMKHLAFLWQQYPGMIILTPTTPGAGWKIDNAKDTGIGGRDISDSDQALKSMEFVYLANFTGNPAISFPMGYAEDVPVGIMVRGRCVIINRMLTMAGHGRMGLRGAAARVCEGRRGFAWGARSPKTCQGRSLGRHASTSDAAVKTTMRIPPRSRSDLLVDSTLRQKNRNLGRR